VKKNSIIFEILSSFIVLTFLNWVLLSLKLSFKYGNFIIYVLGSTINIFVIIEIGKTSKRLFNKFLSQLLFFIGVVVSVIMLGYFFGYFKMELVKF
jgi:hypothetical protein